MKILALCGDAGGTRALIPVLQALRERSDVTLECRAYAAGAAVLADEGFMAEPLGVATDVAAFDALLCGTSVNAQMWELEFAQEASKAGVRTVTFVDSWINYLKRFTLGGRLVLPDAICVTDELAESDMRALGFPADRLAVTGHPGFAACMRYRDGSLRAAHAKRTRALLEVPDGDVLVLYSSQPLSQLWTREKLGFLEDEVYSDVASSLSDIAAATGRRIHLLVKRHPREQDSQALMNDIDAPHLRILDNPATLGKMAAVDWAAACDAAVGINSILLIESAMAGVPAVSYQPNRRIPDPLPSNKTGLTHGITRREDLRAALDKALAGVAPPRATFGPADATQRILSLLNSHQEATP